MTSLSKNIKKCGFPVISLNNYLKVFQNHKLPIQIVSNNSLLNDEEKYKEIIKRLKKLNPDELTPLEALCELKKLKDILNLDI